MLWCFLVLFWWSFLLFVSQWVPFVVHFTEFYSFIFLLVYFFTQELEVFFTHIEMGVHMIRVRAGYVFKYTVCLILGTVMSKDKVYFHKNSQIPNVFTSIWVNRRHLLQSLVLYYHFFLETIRNFCSTVKITVRSKQARTSKALFKCLSWIPAFFHPISHTEVPKG